MGLLMGGRGGLLPMFGASPNPLFGPTWALDGNGRAYNTPISSNSLLFNGGMEAFTAGLANGWLKGGTPTLSQESTIVQEGSSSQKMIHAGTGDFIYQYPNTVAGRFYRFVGYVYGVVRYIANTNFGITTITVQTHSAAQWDVIYLSIQATGVSSGFYFSGVSGGGTGYVDATYIIEMVTASVFATQQSSLANPTVTTKLYSASATAGLVSKLDSPGNPRNYVTARFDVLGNLRLDKTVNGAPTNLQTNAVAFVADAQLEIRWANDTTVGVWYNGSQVGANRTVSDASIISNQHYGVMATDPDCKFSEIRINGNYVPLAFSGTITQRKLLALGDSKTAGDDWVSQLVQALQDETGYSWQELGPRPAVAGYTASTLKTYIDANLSGIVGTANTITINIGANDVGPLPAEATWKGNMTSIIDSLRTKWPGATIYVARPWRRGYGTECNTLADWIDDIVALYPNGVELGPDERVWLENGDDGATYTSDGIHYTAGAQTVCAAQWATVMGY